MSGGHLHPSFDREGRSPTLSVRPPSSFQESMPASTMSLLIPRVGGTRPRQRMPEQGSSKTIILCTVVVWPLAGRETSGSLDDSFSGARLSPAIQPGITSSTMSTGQVFLGEGEPCLSGGARFYLKGLAGLRFPVTVARVDSGFGD